MSNRYVLIDFMHNIYLTVKLHPLSCVVSEFGVPTQVETTIPNFIIKKVWRLGGKGAYNVGVYLEGGCRARKAHFSGVHSTDGTGYKGNRVIKHPSLYKGADLSVELLRQGGVSCYRVVGDSTTSGSEADDLIASAIRDIKLFDKETPIDVITNDSDLLCLVDEQVSVYIRSKRTYAELNAPEIRLYYQVTPRTWTRYFEYTSAFKGYVLPYNSILLFKLIRGDKADNIPASITGYGPKKYNQLMTKMLEDGVDFENTFRYGLNFDGVIRPVVSRYFTSEIVDHMAYIYEGINVRYTALEIPTKIQRTKLQEVLTPFRINLP